MLIDFSLPTIKIESQNGEDWEKLILDFLSIWLDGSEFLTVQTSGSTGNPKQIEISKESMKQSAIMTGSFLDLKKGDTALLCLPIEYIAGKMMLVRASVLGMKLICVKSSTKVEVNQPINFCAMTPMQIDSSFGSFKNIKKVIIGGASLSKSIAEKLSEFKSTQFYETYGMTETVSHIALKNSNKKEDYFTVLPTIKIRIDQRNCLKILVPYISNNEIITNDCVEIINENQFVLKGRIDNIINSGGIKILPESVEKKLEKYIHQNYIISSVLDKKLGEKVVLCLEGNRNEELEIFLKENFKQILNKYEIPKEIYFLEEFPRTNNGKILRKELKNSFNIAN